MTHARPQTIGSALFDEVQLYVYHPERITEFGLLKLERAADKLAGVDAATASTIKAAVAAFRWDEEGVEYWTRNALRLDQSALTFLNAAVSKGLIGDFRAGADLTFKAFQLQKNDAETGLRACQALIFNARFEEALMISQNLKDLSNDFAGVSEQAASALIAIEKLGIELDELRRQLEIGVRVATDARTRIKAVETVVIEDFEGDDRFVVSLHIPGDVNKEIAMDEALVAQFLDDPMWDPMKFSIEFRYLTKDEQLSK